MKSNRLQKKAVWNGLDGGEFHGEIWIHQTAQTWIVQSLRSRHALTVPHGSHLGAAASSAGGCKDWPIRYQQTSDVACFVSRFLVLGSVPWWQWQKERAVAGFNQDD